MALAKLCDDDDEMFTSLDIGRIRADDVKYVWTRDLGVDTCMRFVSHDVF